MCPKRTFFSYSQIWLKIILWTNFGTQNPKKKFRFDPRGVVFKYPFLVREPGGPLRQLYDPFLESQIWMQIIIQLNIGEGNPNN